jgi:multicomponent Na+:H+ antiporter subunit G
MRGALEAAVPFLADALVFLGLFVMTIGVYGIIRMPDVYTRLHAASKAVFLGVISLLAASLVTGDARVVYRVVLIGAFLILTTPVSAHVIARAAYRRGERMKTPGAVDESGRGLGGSGDPDGSGRSRAA